MIPYKSFKPSPREAERLFYKLKISRPYVCVEHNGLKKFPSVERLQFRQNVDGKRISIKKEVQSQMNPASCGQSLKECIADSLICIKVN